MSETTGNTALAGQNDPIVILPCPFCGGKHNANTDTLYHEDECPLSYCSSLDLETIPYDLWNRRATQTAMTYQQAKKAVEIFDGEWIGQDTKRLWAWASEEARKAI